MKKILVTIILTALLFLNNKTFAQNYEVGTNIVNLGAGIGGFWGLGGHPFVIGSYEHGLGRLGAGVFGLGIIGGYNKQTIGYSFPNGKLDYIYTTSYVALNSTWHPDFLNTDKYDVYGAARIGYVNFGMKMESTGSWNFVDGTTMDLNSGFTVGFAIGGRYYFTKKLGAFAELGRDVSYSKVGVFLKF
jgi:hypothetical protein